MLASRGAHRSGLQWGHPWRQHAATSPNTSLPSAAEYAYGRFSQPSDDVEKTEGNSHVLIISRFTVHELVMPTFCEVLLLACPDHLFPGETDCPIMVSRLVSSPFP